MKNVKEKKSNKKGTMDLKPQNILKLKKKKKLNSIISIPKFQQRVINEEWDLEKRIYFHLSTKRSKLKKKKKNYRTNKQIRREEKKEPTNLTTERDPIDVNRNRVTRFPHSPPSASSGENLERGRVEKRWGEREVKFLFFLILSLDSFNVC